MFCYLTQDNILFSNDAFGQHYATEFLFNDQVDQSELWAESIKYYAIDSLQYVRNQKNQRVYGSQITTRHDLYQSWYNLAG